MSEDNASESAEQTTEQQPDPVRRWTFIVLAVVVILIGWYLVADRWTPFTTQARVKAYVVPIAPQVSGRVLEVSVVNNQLVDADQVLVRIDPRSYELAVMSAQAALDSARQDLGAAIAGVKSSRAALAAAQARETKAEQDASRLERIYTEDPGAVSERRVQGARASLSEARSSVAQARANVEKALQQQGLPGDDNSRVLSALTALEKAQLDLERSVVLAPGRGLVTDLSVDRGNFAQTGQPLMTFIAIHDLWIQADLTENNLGHLSEGDEVEFVLDVAPGKVFSGSVRSVGYGVATDSDSLGALPTIDNDPDWLRSAQRFPVIIDFAPDELKESLGLRVGSQVSVIVYTGDNWLINFLGSIYIRLNSLLTYAY